MKVIAALIVAALVVPATAEAGFSASSFRKESKRGANFWNAGSALDSQTETAWMVDPEKKNEGQWVEMDTPSAELDKISVITGWDVDENSFYDYARIKKARIEAWTMEGQERKQVLEEDVEFEDKRGWQTVDVVDSKIGGEIFGGKVRITVLEVYPGKDYPNLAVSEIRVLLKEFDAGTMQITKYPEDAADGHGPNFMEDLKDSTYWAAGAGKTAGSFSMTGAGYGLSSVGIKPGPTGFARPKTVKVEANDLEVVHTMEDKSDLQWLLLPVVVGYTGSAWGTVKVTVVDCYDGDKGLAIAEVKLKAATIEDF
jgi:hypothetical protein